MYINKAELSGGVVCRVVSLRWAWSLSRSYLQLSTVTSHNQYVILTSRSTCLLNKSSQSQVSNRAAACLHCWNYWHSCCFLLLVHLPHLCPFSSILCTRYCWYLFFWVLCVRCGRLAAHWLNKSRWWQHQETVGTRWWQHTALLWVCCVLQVMALWCRY